MPRPPDRVLYLLLFLLLTLTLVSQVPFTIDVVRVRRRPYWPGRHWQPRRPLRVVCYLVMPWLSIPLGFWVAAVRQRDLRVWLVLGILLGLSQLVRPFQLGLSGWPTAIGFITMTFREFAVRWDGALGRRNVVHGDAGEGLADQVLELCGGAELKQIFEEAVLELQVLPAQKRALGPDHRLETLHGDHVTTASLRH